MAAQRRRFGGRMLDLDRMSPDDLEAEDGWESHAEKAFDAGVDAVNERNRRLHGEPVDESPTDPYWQGGL